MHAAALAGQRPLRRLDRRLQRRRRRRPAARSRGSAAKAAQSASSTLREKNWSSAFARDRAEAVGVDVVQRDADDPAARDEPGAARGGTGPAAACVATGRPSRRPGRRPADIAGRPARNSWSRGPSVPCPEPRGAGRSRPAAVSRRGSIDPQDPAPRPITGQWEGVAGGRLGREEPPNLGPAG